MYSVFEEKLVNVLEFIFIFKTPLIERVDADASDNLQ